MFEWLESFCKEHLLHQDMIILIPTHHMNPEQFYYYQKFEYYQVKPMTDRENSDFCEPLDISEMTKKIDSFAPKGRDDIAEMWTVLREDMEFEKVIAVEVDHCPQSYACLLVSK